MESQKSVGTSKKTSVLKNIGPGFLLAGAAIGVSHLVQSTRAGADYGYILIWALLLACISKYPFLEFGARYVAGTGKHLISGYKQLGKIPYYLFIFITVASMFIIQAAVTIVTAGLAERLFNFGLSPFVWSFIIFGASIALLLIGKYPGLDKSMKIIVSVLTVATLAAVCMALGIQKDPIETVEIPSLWTTASLGFIIAFMGWMPIPLDAAVWHSIWTKEKAHGNKEKLTLKNAFLDFNIGYFSACFIGVLFFLLGVLVMFGSGESFSSNSVEFSSQLINLYAKTLGDWSKPIIAIAAFVTMLSTVITVTDAYPRVISELFHPEVSKTDNRKKRWQFYKISIFIIPILSLAILYFTSGSFTILVDFAAGLSFLSAPILAWFNYKLVTGKEMPEADRPGKNYRLFTMICFVMLLIFNIAYLGYNFFV
ncbi:NRAMP family divalent metal transporter [Zunongwangia sp. HGR-M22]|uniref:NRAMP family divalent metal transporter n=1 Tax=Zunongwangia sp. HGR-M22 TaxID=3015168 RepID=UPI0022DE23F8|nr:divalent metal cation transporter [Zunongwangia sp. HGR-M22]WBL26904.1 divalent metal cation transporter [Zunongwangia sp. HGR-M22]